MDEKSGIRSDKKSIAIEVRELYKRFGDVEAVCGIDFNILEGELFGFLGPNGAGKTTTINILTGLARPDAGSVSIGGVDCIRSPRSVQNLIGVVPDESNLYPELTGFDNLTFCASLYGMRRGERRARADELLTMFNIKHAADRKFGSYSKGMKRKLAIAASIIHRPRILFLDEPTTGIDVASARQVRALIAGLNREGTTVFLTTHYIEEAERLCGRIAFLVEGKIRRIDTVENLLKPFGEKHVVHISCSILLDDVRRTLSEAFPEALFACLEQGRIRAESLEEIRIGALIRHLEDHEVEVFEARKGVPSLEDVFVHVTGIESGVMNKTSG